MMKRTEEGRTNERLWQWTLHSKGYQRNMGGANSGLAEATWSRTTNTFIKISPQLLKGFIQIDNIGSTLLIYAKVYDVPKSTQNISVGTSVRIGPDPVNT